MERLTFRGQNGVAYIDSQKNGIWHEAEQKLAAYEDTGLTPDLVNKVNKRLAEYEISGLTSAEVSELAKAKAEGRLIILQISPKDKLYCWSAVGELQECEIQNIHISGTTIQYNITYSKYGEDDFGKIVFLSREQAEAALARKSHE